MFHTMIFFFLFFQNEKETITQFKSVKLSQQILLIQCPITNLFGFLLSHQGFLGSSAISFMLVVVSFYGSVNCSVVISLPFLSFNVGVVGVDMIGLVLGFCAGAGVGSVSSVVNGISVGRTSSFLLSIKFVGMYLGLICVQCLCQTMSSTWSS